MPPTHDFLCPNGHLFEIYQTLSKLDKTAICEKCFRMADKVFLTPPNIYKQADVCYDSPIDGRPITSKQARIEDLKRNGCRPYETGEKEEWDRRRAAAERALDSKIEASVEETLSKWPARKRELLEQEVNAGVTTETIRRSGDGL